MTRLNKPRIIMIFFCVAIVAIAGVIIAGINYSNSQDKAAANASANPTSTSVQNGFPSLPAIPSLSASTSFTSTAKNIPVKTPVAVVQKNLPYSAPPFTQADWIKDWGTILIAENSLSVNAAASTTGGATFLAGADSWTNYDFEASVNWIQGQTFSLLARQKDIKNFLYCEFDDHWVNLVQRDNGTDRVIASNPSPHILAGAADNLGIRVFNNKAACAVDHGDVLTALVTQNDPQQGPIGFASWDPVRGAGRAVVKNVQVTALPFDTISIASPKPVPPPATPTSTPPPTSTTPEAISLPFNEASFLGDTNWKATWGKVSVAHAAFMDIAAVPPGTGATIYLDNANQWGDYTFGASVRVIKGTGFGLLARYVDDKNNVACNFDQTDGGNISIQLVQTLNGNRTVLASGDILNANLAGNSDLDVWIQVLGTRGTCSFNHHVISNLGNGVTLNPPYRGSIGFSLENQKADNGEILVNSVSVLRSQ